MDQRERFEAWARGTWGERITATNENNVYVQPALRGAWLAWQAAEAATLERAFEVIKLAIGTLALHGHEADAKKIAAEWRKLAAERRGE